MKNNKEDLSFSRSTVLVTGACGTVGAELVRQLAVEPNTKIIGIDNNESGIFQLSEVYSDVDNVEAFICDIRDKDGLTKRMRGVDYVIHAAALKHVGVCERSPEDAIRTNIIGAQNIIDSCFQSRVKKVLFTSSDKAVNPTNVMGTSKLMGERLFTAANAQRSIDGDPLFSTTRFGNVLGSSGSVVPLFAAQIESGGPVTLTDPQMTRFIMSLRDAVALVLESFHMAAGGEVFITKMPVARIIDLAEVLISELSGASANGKKAVEIETIGPRPGEKMYEELLSHEETRRTVELNEFLVVNPPAKTFVDKKYTGGNFIDSSNSIDPYNSAQQTPLSKQELLEVLTRADLLTKDTAQDYTTAEFNNEKIEEILTSESELGEAV